MWSITVQRTVYMSRMYGAIDGSAKWKDINEEKEWKSKSERRHIMQIVKSIIIYCSDSLLTGPCHVHTATCATWNYRKNIGFAAENSKCLALIVYQMSQKDFAWIMCQRYQSITGKIEANHSIDKTDPSKCFSTCFTFMTFNLKYFFVHCTLHTVMVKQ